MSMNLLRAGMTRIRADSEATINVQMNVEHAAATDVCNIAKRDISKGNFGCMSFLEQQLHLPH